MPWGGVRLSVTFVYSVETNKYIFKFFFHHRVAIIIIIIIIIKERFNVAFSK